MTELEHAIQHIKTRADAWAVKEVTEALRSISERLEKALSQEPICDRDCEHCTWTECPIEPCDDAISREAVMNAICDYVAFEEYEDKSHTFTIRPLTKRIKQLPSVTQKPKTGHWDKGYTFPDGNYWMCTNCKELIKVKYPMNYCNNCGAKMVESQESEDKECI